MTAFSGLGLGLSLVFGCLLLALVAELYYLLWWKKRITDREIEDEYGNFAKEYLFHLICWKRAYSSSDNSAPQGRKDQDMNGHEPDPELGLGKDVLLKSIVEEGVESELMRLHNLAGPPRFLFTIKEETKEDLESEDGKSRGDRSRKGSRTRSLSDLMVGIDTQFLTPLASPRLKSPPLNPLDAYKQHGFNPLFESSTEAELTRLRSSPPPKFKFLRDAEEKLYRRLMEEAEKRASLNSVSGSEYGTKASNNSTLVGEERDGSMFTFMVGNKNPSSSSQVLPLASSPTTFRPVVDNNKPPNSVR
ncbi:Transmembrane protein [Parasponia andersonii]|uniref:Transmembrane protein n=1 Tax=Parasponia andersonii TaxID=3476 RepID=A0A2P5CD08_PARAD|nr:Transmembrane protein [Parasponia andersonii]